MPGAAAQAEEPCSGAVLRASLRQVDLCLLALPLSSNGDLLSGVTLGCRGRLRSPKLHNTLIGAYVDPRNGQVSFLNLLPH